MNTHTTEIDCPTCDGNGYLSLHPERECKRCNTRGYLELSDDELICRAIDAARAAGRDDMASALAELRFESDAEVAEIYAGPCRAEEVA